MPRRNQQNKIAPKNSKEANFGKNFQIISKLFRKMSTPVIAEKSKTAPKGERHLPWIEKYRPKLFKVITLTSKL